MFELKTPNRYALVKNKAIQKVGVCYSASWPVSQTYL